MTTRPNAFPAGRRLSGNLRFAAVFDAKVKRSAGPLVIYSLPNALTHPRLGLSVSRRIGIAVVRNRIKRMLREAFRLHPNDGRMAYDIVIVVRPHEPAALVEYQNWLASLLISIHAAWEQRRNT